MSTLGIVLLIVAGGAFGLVMLLMILDIWERAIPVLVMFMVFAAIAGVVCTGAADSKKPKIYVTPSGTFVSSDTLMQVRGDYIENLNNY